MSDLEKIKQLRQSTGAGFKDCNIALEETDGDLDKAIEVLRVKGVSKASKKMSRTAKFKSTPNACKNRKVFDGRKKVTYLLQFTLPIVF